MSDEEVIEKLIGKEKKEEALTPIIVCQFVFHPQTGEIEAGYHPGLSHTDMIKIKGMLEERLASISIDLVGSIAEAVKSLNEKMNLVLSTQKALLFTVKGIIESAVPEKNEAISTD